MSKRDDRYEERKQEEAEKHEEVKQGLESIRDELRDGTERIADAVPSEGAVKGVQSGLDAIKDALDANSGRIQRGLVAVGVGVGVGFLVNKFSEFVSNQTREINKKTDLINAICVLQRKYTPLTYDIVVSRAGVDNMPTADERRNLLNILIGNGTVIEYQYGNSSALRIDLNSEGFQEHRKAICACMGSPRSLTCDPTKALKKVFTVDSTWGQTEQWQMDGVPPTPMPPGFFAKLAPPLKPDIRQHFSIHLSVAAFDECGVARLLSPTMCQVDNSGGIILFFKQGEADLRVGTSIRFGVDDMALLRNKSRKAFGGRKVRDLKAK